MKKYNFDEMDIDLKQVEAFRQQLEQIANISLPEFTDDPEAWLVLAFNENDPNFHSENYRWARQFVTEHTVAQNRETLGAYTGDLFYAAKTPVANAIGIELGTGNHNKQAKTVERCGFGIYIRSDHAFNKCYKTPVALA